MVLIHQKIYLRALCHLVQGRRQIAIKWKFSAISHSEPLFITRRNLQLNQAQEASALNWFWSEEPWTKQLILNSNNKLKKIKIKKNTVCDWKTLKLAQITKLETFLIELGTKKYIFTLWNILNCKKLYIKEENCLFFGIEQIQFQVVVACSVTMFIWREGKQNTDRSNDLKCIYSQSQSFWCYVLVICILNETYSSLRSSLGNNFPLVCHLDLCLNTTHIHWNKIIPQYWMFKVNLGSVVHFIALHTWWYESAKLDSVWRKILCLSLTLHLNTDDCAPLRKLKV